MPVYEYGCEAGHRFEVKQKFSDEPLTTCRECDRPVTKVISVPAISFKGPGWYVTDYSDKMKPPTSEEKSTSSKEPAKPESTTASSGSDGKGSAPAAAPAAPAAASKSETGAAPPASASSGS